MDKVANGSHFILIQSQEDESVCTLGWKCSGIINNSKCCIWGEFTGHGHAL